MSILRRFATFSPWRAGSIFRRMRTQITFAHTLVVISLVVFFGCGDDDPDGAADGIEIALKFKPVFGEKAAACGVLYEGFGPDGDQRAGLEELRLYIHDIQVADEAGNVLPATIVDEPPYQDAGVAYLHFANPSDGCLIGEGARDEIRIRVPEGTYRGVTFRLGVPEHLNHLDPSRAASPLNITPMSWGWMMGYLFFRAEFSVVSDDEHGHAPNFAVHIGSMGCDGTLVPEPDIHCDYPNRSTIELSDCDPESDVILIDLAALLGETDLRPEGEGHHGSAGCMSEIDPEGKGFAECIEPMTSLGIDYGANPAQMDVFRVDG